MAKSNSVGAGVGPTPLLDRRS